MGKMKEVFQEEQESRSVQDKFLDEEWEMRVRQVQEQQKQLLNQIFESWGEVFGVKDVKSKSNEEAIKVVPDGAVEINHDGSKKLETTSSGVNVIGSLTVDGSAISGGGSGKVLQVLTATANNSTTSSGSFQSTGCSVNITPSNTANKILAVATGAMNNSGAGNGGTATIFRDSTNLAPNNDGMAGYFGEDNSNNIECTATFHVLDSPSTTSQVTYEIKVRAFSGTQGFGHRNTQRLTVIEIDGT